MADVSSQAFWDGKIFHAADDLINYFNSHFPLPQLLLWQQYIISTKMSSQIIACLRGRQLPLAQLQRIPRIVTNIGKHGKATAQNVRLTPIYWTAQHNKEILSSAPSLLGSGLVPLEEDARSRHKESQMLWRQSQRPSNWLENKVPCTEETTNIP